MGRAASEHEAHRRRRGAVLGSLIGPKARFDRFERAQDGQARSSNDREWMKEFERSGQLLSDQIIATAANY
ncbi:MAG: hypothetical protein EBZ48_12885 [Proteobacteria bacterium]|nr:hypothetical protein [Pseudomonadota bacterium]